MLNNIHFHTCSRCFKPFRTMCKCGKVCDDCKEFNLIKMRAKMKKNKKQKALNTQGGQYDVCDDGRNNSLDAFVTKEQDSSMN